MNFCALRWLLGVEFCALRWLLGVELFVRVRWLLGDESWLWCVGSDWM